MLGLRRRRRSVVDGPGSRRGRSSSAGFVGCAVSPDQAAVLDALHDLFLVDEDAVVRVQDDGRTSLGLGNRGSLLLLVSMLVAMVVLSGSSKTNGCR